MVVQLVTVGGIGNMEVTINNFNFISSHQYKQYSISLCARIGSIGTTLIYFSPCMHENLWEESENVLKKLLEYVFKNPGQFMNHWSKVMPANELKQWISNTNLWGMEFRLHTDGSSGPFYKWYMNDENKELKELSESFINYFK